MGVTFQHRTVHESTWVSFIRITAYIFLYFSTIAGSELPFQAGGEACTSTSTDAAVQNSLDDLIRRHLRQHLAQRFITVSGNVLLDVFRIDHAAVT